MTNNQPITELQLSQDSYNHLIVALQLYIKSPKLSEGSLEEVLALYQYVKIQYSRRYSPELRDKTRIPSKTEPTLPSGELI